MSNRPCVQEEPFPQGTEHSEMKSQCSRLRYADVSVPTLANGSEYWTTAESVRKMEAPIVNGTGDMAVL